MSRATIQQHNVSNQSAQKTNLMADRPKEVLCRREAWFSLTASGTSEKSTSDPCFRLHGCVFEDQSRETKSILLLKRSPKRASRQHNVETTETKRSPSRQFTYVCVPSAVLRGASSHLIWELYVFIFHKYGHCVPSRGMRAQSPRRAVINGLCLGYCNISTVGWASLSHVTGEHRRPTRRVCAHRNRSPCEGCHFVIARFVRFRWSENEGELGLSSACQKNIF